MQDIHTEKTFESNIETALVDETLGDARYVSGDKDDFDAELGLDKKGSCWYFIQQTQSSKWDQLVEIHQNQVEEKLCIDW